MKFLSVLFTTILLCTFILSSCFNDDPLVKENAKGSARQANEEGYNLKWAANAIDESIGTEPEVREGILHFRDEKTFLTTINKLKDLSAKQLLSYSNSKKFKSVLSIYEEVDSSLTRAIKAKDIVKFKSILKEYQRYVKIDKDSSLSHTFRDNTKASILNEDGFVYVGKMLLYFTPQKEEIILDGDKSKINTTSETVQTFPLFDFPPVVTSTTSCSNGIAKTITSDFGWDRVRLEVFVNRYVTPQTGGLYSVSAYVHAKGWQQTWYPFPYFYWGSTPLYGHKLNCVWKLYLYRPIPGAFYTEEQNQLIIEDSIEIGFSGSLLTQTGLTSPNLATHNLVLPGTGYYQGSFATVPMTCD